MPRGDCDHELCNQSYESAFDMTVEQIEQILMCGVEKNVIEFAGVTQDGVFLYSKKVNNTSDASTYEEDVDA